VIILDIIQINKFKKKKYNTSIALGNFDGVHIGHMELIKSMIRDSEELDLKSSVLLFENHTKSIVKGQAPSLLTDNVQRTEIIEDLGVDILYKTNFNSHIRKLSPKEFIKKILIEILDVKAITVGYNYKFGYKAMADVKDLWMN
jgi:riboflavin kinase / FMN adenylyltransferase